MSFRVGVYKEGRSVLVYFEYRKRDEVMGLTLLSFQYARVLVSEGPLVDLPHAG